MKKLSPLLLSAFLLISGCTIDDGSDDVVNEFPPENPTPSAEIPNEAPSLDISDGVASGLIPSTNPQTRLAQVNERKSDPFSLSTPSVVIQYVEPTFANGASADNGVTTNGNFNGEVGTAGNGGNGMTGATGATGAGNGMTGAGNGMTGATGATGAAGNGGRGATGATGATGAKGATGAGNSGNVPAIPNGEVFEPLAPPEPLYARSILISGIIDVGGENVALISTPDNNPVRSIREGDVISNEQGNVLVKRIQLSRPSNQMVTLRNNGGFVERNLGPLQGTVVLEQLGENIIKNIGESERINAPES
ncbi:MAG: hypothetical protein IGQ45_02220 [Cyanobacterium sp. T60_A2020_053]|nr:hypothetical protein [Cyanobacterium sp. T60_A2020_053]